LEQLKELKDRALIIAGGSSVNALTDAGIVPHFGGAIDPNPTQYTRLRQGLGFEVPFFYRNRVLHEAAKMISGPKLYLRGGDGYNSAEWIEKLMKVSGKVLGGGHSIANFAIEIAFALGCSPIILVGFDLAYTNDTLYASGVEEEPSESSEEKVVWQDFQGHPIKTAWKWIVEANWITELKKKHRSLKLLNATEGGLAIQGVPNVPFQEAVDKYLGKSYDLDGLVHLAIQEAGTIGGTKEKIVHAMETMLASLGKTIEILDALLYEIKKTSSVHPLERSEVVLVLEQLHAEIAFQYILDVFDRMRDKLDFFRRRFRLSPTVTQNKKAQFERELLFNHYFFLKEVTIVNQILITRCLHGA